MDTIFQKIIRRELPADIVYETEEVLAFLDINPTNPGHTLVVPKVWSTNLTDISPTSWQYVMAAVHHLAPRIQAAVHADAVNIIMNSGEAAGQVVPHTHVHIVPRLIHDGYYPWPGHPTSPETRAHTADTIRTALTMPRGDS